MIFIYVLSIITGISFTVIYFSSKHKNEKYVTNLTEEEYLAFQKYLDSIKK